MDPKTITNIGSLKDGDRFYFKSDNSKKVWQIEPKPGRPRTWKFKGKVFTADVRSVDDKRLEKYSKHTTQVVFLRHTKDDEGIPSSAGSGMAPAVH